jgi:aldose 1-epimerase
VRIEVLNLAADPMPLAIGFHPYFVLPGVKRDDAVAHIPARLHVDTDAQLVATGQFTPAGLPDQLPLKDHKFDDGFTDLARDPSGNAAFRVEGGGRAIEVAFGPKFPVAVVYAPPGEQFFCFEPMTTLTNGINLAYQGRYAGLQTVAPNQMWSESFRVRPSGF